MTAIYDASRRRAIRTLFFSSAAMSLNLRATAAPSDIGNEGINFLAIGDFGTGSNDQKAVSKAMQEFGGKNQMIPDAMLMLGDNFYSSVKGGFTTESDRWRTDIEEMYPKSAFPKPFYPVLGNHDYHDNAGGELVQLNYAKKSSGRWTFPSKWYSIDLGSPTPLVTLICLDSNLPSVSGSGQGEVTDDPLGSMTAEEQAAQRQWLEVELMKPRAPFTIVAGHHPMYSNGAYGDTKPLIADWEPLFQKYKVHAYLCGHDHDLQHLELEGKFTSHVLSGGGGASIREISNPRKMPYGKAVHGFTHLHVLPGALTITHYGLNGNPLHRFTKRPSGEVEMA